MESFRSLLQHRRSVREFKTAPVEQETVETLLEAALLAPTAKNRRPWHFIVVDEKKEIKSLAKCKPHGADFLADAPLAIVVAADEQQAAAWIEDASIAAIILQLAAEEHGLGSCWIQIRGRSAPDGGSAADFVRRQLSIPEGTEVEAIIALGYPAASPEPHDLRKLPYERVHYGRFGRSR